MKILCVSDQIDPVVYSNSIKERFADIDMVLCAGDLPMEYIDFIVSSLNVPTFFVFGNHNLNEYHLYHGDDLLLRKAESNHKSFEYTGHGATYAGFKVLRIKKATIEPLLIAGVSGSIRYNKGLCQFTDFEMILKLIAMIPKLIFNKIRYGRYLDIFLAHSPARHIQDREDSCHRGFNCFRWFMKTFKPKYMLHGHIHLYDMQTPRTAEYFNTSIINVFSHYVLDFSTGEEK